MNDDAHLDAVLDALDAIEAQIRSLRSIIAMRKEGTAEGAAQRAEMAEATDNRSSPASVVTQRQYEVITQLSRGLSNRQIARALGMSEATVKSHLYAAYRKLGVSSRSEAILELLRRGFGDMI
ncbi:response regulator transcription factor [Allorhizocola rhizosphaerae]|uniref:response regulator transcription factor n=1 Tax=Allorhizocola rhizosphaerae TaxID=1872709 RepID=UPI0013C33259|nr:LuxR C-terminal-related transcriptional regulator [Allorhizocola rhizosphaerae]